METKYALRNLYSRTLGDEQMEIIRILFQRTLEIRNASLDDLVIELEELREGGCEDKPRIRALYKYLDEVIPPTSDMRYVLIQFLPISVACYKINTKTELHLRHTTSYITCRDMGSQVGTDHLIACGPVRQRSAIKSS